MHVCTYVCMYACMCVCMYVCLYVCIHACVYIYMYVCMYVYIQLFHKTMHQFLLSSKHFKRFDLKTDMLHKLSRRINIKLLHFGHNINCTVCYFYFISLNCCFQMSTSSKRSFS